MTPTNDIVPTMLYDGDCGFCRRHVAIWQRRTRGLVSYATYQSSGAQYPQLTTADCERSIQLIMPDGTVYSGAHAVLRALATTSWFYRVLLWKYDHVPLVAPVAEAMYRWVSRNRMRLSGGKTICKNPPTPRRGE